MSSSSKLLRRGSDPTMEHLCLAQDTRPSKEFTRVDPFTEDHFMLVMSAIKLTRDISVNDFKYSNMAVLKHIE